MGSLPKIVYIGGHGRSGTTIVDRVLSEVTGAFSAGEVHRFWEYGLARDWTCSCGAPLRKCPFWSDVLQRSFSAAGCSESEILEAWKTVARPKSLLPLLYPTLRSARFQRRLSVYRSFLRTFYKTVSQHSRKEVIVDSSGSPLHGYVISDVCEADVTMLHLIRDGRAVAYSNQKSKANPGAQGQSGKMCPKPALQTAITWPIYNQLLSDVSDRFEDSYIRRYENLFRSPKKEFYSLSEELELSQGMKDVFINEHVIQMDDCHSGQGNPSRFINGQVSLKVDKEWKQEISFFREMLVSTLDHKKLKKYGYK